MHSPKRLKITDVNPHLICVLCGGYYIDATTVIECLHSFCKSCIVKYLEKNKYCPICDVQIHKTTPLLSIRPDKTLQNIVYKLVPSLFKNEMQRRSQFYEKHPESLPALPEQRGEVTDNTPILFPDELLIVSLEYKDIQVAQQAKRYLHCPASLPVSHLIKLIKGKFNLNAKHQVHVFFKDDPLMEHITLMDIAYTYQCRRKIPIHLTYKILELKRKTIRIINSEPKKEVKEEKHPEKEWKEVQLQISENGVMSVRNVESCECSPIPAVEAPPVFSPSLVTSVNHLNYTSLSIPPVSQCTPAYPQSAALVHPGIITNCVAVPTSDALGGTSASSGIKPSPTDASSPPVSCAPSTSPTEAMDTSVAKEDTTTSTPTLQSASSSSITEPPSDPAKVESSQKSKTFESAPLSLAPASSSSETVPSELPPTESLISQPSVQPVHDSHQRTVASPSPAVSLPVSTSSASSLVTSSAPSPISIATSSKSHTSLTSSLVTPAMSVSVSTPPPLLVSTQAPKISSPSMPLIGHPINMPSSPVSLSSYPPISFTTSSSMVSSHPIISSSLASPCQGMDSSVVTTVAGMKPSTNLVPANFSIMSPSRSQTEPIVSVSKVSKDQVRKPNNVIEVNKLSISRVPPGGMKEKGENLNKIVNKLSPNERVIGNTSVTIRPVTNSPNQSKLHPMPKSPGIQSPPTPVSKEKPPQPKYKTLKAPAKQWNPSIDRATMLMKQNTDQNKPSRFFKIRNMPRFLGNPASGVKPLYACPEEPVLNSSQKPQKLTLMKVDPKSIPTSSIPRSPTKQPPPYTPGSPKITKPPPSYSDPKSFMNSRLPSPAHAGAFLSPYHLLYGGYPGFSHEANRMLSPELIRTMCAYHPSLPPSIGMLFNPLHPMQSRPPDGFKPEATPAVQRIPPSKTDTPPPSKPLEDKRFPSPVGISENKKLTPPPPASPKDSEKTSPTPPSVPPTSVPETPPKESSPVQVEQPPSNPIVEAKDKDNPTEEKNHKENSDDSKLMKINCDDINLNNNNNSKESPPSQPSENLANRSQ